MIENIRETINSEILKNKNFIIENLLSFNNSGQNTDIELVNNDKVLTSPLVLSKKQHIMIQRDLKRIISLLIKIPELYFDGDYDNFFKGLSLSELEKDVLKDFKNIDINTFIARPDIVFDGDNFKVIEFNVSSAIAGILTNEVLGNRLYSKIFNNYNLLNGIKYNTSDVIKSLSDIFKEKSKNKNDFSVSILMDAEYQKEDIVYLTYLKELLEGEGLTVYLCDPNELEYDDGLFYKNHRIDVAFRAFILDMKNAQNSLAFQNIIKALKNNQCTLITDFSCKMFSSKVNLAFLSELADSEQLSKSDRDLLRKHIPWTRILKSNNSTFINGKQINLVDYVINHKNELIIKPFNGAGGKQVVIGKLKSDDEWTSIIQEKSIFESYIVQEYIEPIRVSLPSFNYLTNKLKVERFLTVFSAMYINNNVSGYYIRCQKEGNEIINATSGALATNAIII